MCQNIESLRFCVTGEKEMYGFLCTNILSSTVTFLYDDLCLGMLVGGNMYKDYLCSTWEGCTALMLKWMRQHWSVSAMPKHSTDTSSNIFYLFHEALIAEFDLNLQISSINLQLHMLLFMWGQINTEMFAICHFVFCVKTQFYHFVFELILLFVRLCILEKHG